MRQIITAIATTTLCLVVACGDWVELRPASAQDGPGGAGGTDTTAAAGGSDPGPGTCDCPAPEPARKVELARAECVGGFASFADVTGPGMRQAIRGGDAWLEATSGPAKQQQVHLQWDEQRGLFVRCPIGEEMTATLWGLE